MIDINKLLNNCMINMDRPLLVKDSQADEHD